MGSERAPDGSVTARLTVAGVGVIGLVVTLGFVIARLSPGLGERRFSLGVVTVDDLQEGQLSTAAAIVLIFIAAVLTGRLRRDASRRNLLVVTGLSILAFDNLLSALLTTGFDSLSANRFATWAAAGDGVAGAALLVLGAALPNRRLNHRGVWKWVLASSAVLAASIIAVAWWARDVLPPAFATLPTQPRDLQPFSEHPALLTLELAIAIGYGVAAFGFARIADAEDDDLHRWLSVGTAVAAIAFLNYALVPSQFTELLYIGDYFFLLAVAVLLVGAVREIGNAEAAIVRRAVYLERRRIARDLHDGVAQELAYLTTQARAVIRNPQAHPMERMLDTIERALDETREAISLLNLPTVETTAAAVEHAALRTARRGGTNLELDLDSRLRVSRDAHVALVRITREAVSNAVRHGNARLVTVELWGETGARLRITDDGCGFDPAKPRPSGGHGITGMRERATSLRGEFELVSSPGEGTVLNVGLP